MDIKVLVATHKKYRMPRNDIYLPIHVGAEGKKEIGFQRDNTGDNISSRNSRFSELTAVYWAWKNLTADYIGLVHYRRYFTTVNWLKRLLCKDKFEFILKRNELEKVLKTNELIVPNKRKYYIESIRSHHIHLPYTYEKDFQVFEDTMRRLEPEYMEAFETVMKRSWAHMFNMFVMKKEMFDAYCAWMFPILLEVDRKINVSGYTQREARIIGDYGEFMLDIWIEKNGIPYKEVNVMFMEKQNWLSKGGEFLWRKLLNWD